MHDIDFRSDGSLKFNLFSSNYRCMFVHEMIIILSSTVLPTKIIKDGQIITTIIDTQKIFEDRKRRSKVFQLSPSGQHNVYIIC